MKWKLKVKKESCFFWWCFYFVWNEKQSKRFFLPLIFGFYFYLTLGKQFSFFTSCGFELSSCKSITFLSDWRLFVWNKVWSLSEQAERLLFVTVVEELLELCPSLCLLFISCAASPQRRASRITGIIKGQKTVAEMRTMLMRPACQAGRAGMERTGRVSCVDSTDTRYYRRKWIQLVSFRTGKKKLL